MKLAADRASSSRAANRSEIARCQRGEQVGKGEAAYGDGQQAAPLQPGRQHGHDRSADGIGEGEGGDQMAGGDQADVQVSRQGGQQPGDHKALGADGEGAEG